MARRYGEAEDRLIREHYRLHGSGWRRWWCNGGDLLPGRNRASLRYRAAALGIHARGWGGRRPWTEAEDCAILLDLSELAADLDRSPSAVMNRMLRLSLRARAERGD